MPFVHGHTLDMTAFETKLWLLGCLCQPQVDTVDTKPRASVTRTAWRYERVPD